MPVSGSEVTRARTGYEKIIAHRCNDLYAFTAKQDGTVIETNESLKIIKIRYKDGTTEAISYSPQYGECSDMVTEQLQVLTVKKGDRFKKHEVLRYNPWFFEEDIDVARQVNFKLGIIARVMFTENSLTFEDSNAISREMSDRLTISPVEIRMVTITTNALVHSFQVVGDEVELSTPLLVFEPDDTSDLSGIVADEAALQYLEKLNRSSPKAKYKGRIVDVRILHACEIEDMHPSVAKMIKSYTTVKSATGRYVSEATNKYLYPGGSKVPAGSKYKGVVLDENTIVLQYYIKENMTSHAGDKIVIDSSLKTVTCKILDTAPTTESGKPIDVVFSASSNSNRIVNSPILTGLTETVMAALEDSACELYFT